MSEFKVGQEVNIPSSSLGTRYGVGKIIAIWNDKMAVDFSGHLGHYTIKNHTISPVNEFMGMKVVIDDSIPKNEIHIGKINGRL